MTDEERREKLDRLSKRTRAAFIDGAAEHSRRTLGRPLTDEELQRVLRHYPGDWTRERGDKAE